MASRVAFETRISSNLTEKLRELKQKGIDKAISKGMRVAMEGGRSREGVRSYVRARTPILTGATRKSWKVNYSAFGDSYFGKLFIEDKWLTVPIMRRRQKTSKKGNKRTWFKRDSGGGTTKVNPYLYAHFENRRCGAHAGYFDRSTREAFDRIFKPTLAEALLEEYNRLAGRKTKRS